MTAILDFNSIGNAERKLLLQIADLADAGGGLTEEHGQEALALSANNINTYEYLCQKGLVEAKTMTLGHGVPYGLSPLGLQCVAFLKDEKRF